MSKNSSAEPRGVRSNNPGNIDYNPATKWQGLDNPPSDGRFCRFITPVHGIRALARTLITYYDKHDLNTVERIINRWAPPVENNTNSYVAQVCKDTGFTKEQKLDLHLFEVLAPLVKAIIKHENGKQPYSEAQITKGLVMAGVESTTKPLAKSRTVQGSTVSLAGTAGVGITEQAQTLIGGAGQDDLSFVSKNLEPLVEYSEWIKLAFLATVLVGIGMVLYARWDDRKKGIR